MIYRRLMGYPTWGTRGSYENLERMRRQMENLFNQISAGSTGRTRAGVFPAINLTEDTNAYFIRAELPGVKAEHLDIQATGTNLSISGERQTSTDMENFRYHRREREAGQFSRIIGLPGDIDSDRIQAKLVNGVLTVTVPKAEAAKPRQISIK